MAKAIVLVMADGALGSAVRYLVSHLFSGASEHQRFSFGTLAVNVVGSLGVGYLLSWPADHVHNSWRLFAAIGFCGGFITFSTFSYETMAYWHGDQFPWFMLNIALNNTLLLCAVLIGARLHSVR